MTKPIFIIAGQSNGRRMADEIRDSLTSRYGQDGFIAIQVAISGARLTWENADGDDWATNSELPNTLISQLMDIVTSNPTAHAAGMIWVQGESDTRTGANAHLYASLLQSMIQRIREEVPDANTTAAESFTDLPVVISQLAETSAEYFERVAWDTVILEQAKVALRDENVGLLDPDAVAREAGFTPGTMFADALHYSDDFNQVLAEKLVAQVIEMDATGSFAIAPLVGDSSTEVLTGNSANDTIRGRGGADQLLGQGGNDRIFGGKSNDQIYGGDGADVLWGYRGNDSIHAGAGNDKILAGLGKDTANGGAGDDYIKGGGGKDVLSGDAGADQIYGGTWGDKLYGGGDDDFLFGEAGRDLLSGGDGNDVLTGGRANKAGDGVRDIFVFNDTPSTMSEFDRIKDFEAGIDQINISDFNFSSFQAIIDVSIETPYGVEITLASDHFLLIQYATLAELSAGDLIL